MIGFSLLAVTVAVSLVGLAILCVTATRPAVALQPADGLPFGLADLTDPAADTMTAGPAETTLAGDWHEVELNHLGQVEDLLDSLEARNVRHREMAVVGNDKFVVRWR